MADNVTLPAGGTGDTTPKVSTQQVTADSSQVQDMMLASVSGGTRTRITAAALADAMANPTTIVLGGDLFVFNGTTWDRLRGDTTNGAWVNVKALPALPTGANTIGAVTQASGPWSQNLTQVAGASIAQGHGTAASAIRVELPTDGTGVVNAAQSGTWTVQPGNTANTTPWLTANYDQTGTIYNGATALTVNYAAIAAATSGDNTLLAADATHKIRVLSMAIVASAAVNLYFTSAAGGTVIFGGSTNKIQLAANGGFVLPYNPHGWFQNSSINQLLNMNLSGAVAVSGGFTYVLV